MLHSIQEYFHKNSPLSFGEENEQAVRVALVALLIDAGLSNDEFKEAELNKTVELVKEEFQLGDADAGELLEIVRVVRQNQHKSEEFLELMRNNFTVDQKVKVLSLVWKVLKADHFIHVNESAFAVKIRKGLGLTPEQAVFAQKISGE